MPKKQLPYLFSLLLASNSPFANSCDDKMAVTTATRFVEKVILSEDCASALKGFEADDYWHSECARRARAEKLLDAEFLRRTKASVTGIRTQGKSRYALVQFTGPDPVAFQMALLVAQECAVGKNPLLAPVVEPGHCDNDFWASVPVKEYSSAIPLECRNGHWAIAALPD